jgi:hypothetical protein
MAELREIPRDVNDERQVAMADAPIAQPGRGRSEEEQRLLDDVDNVHRHMAEIGSIPATIVNVTPLTLRAQGQHTSHIEVPSCPPGEGFNVHVEKAYSIDFKDNFGSYTPRPITAISKARDFVEQQKRLERGGVFCYLGDHLPGKNPDPKKAAEERKELEKARKDWTNWCRKMVQEANTEWARPNKQGAMNISELHRMAAQYLLHYKMLNKEPDWLTVIKPEADIVPPCPRCGSEVNPGAFACKGCNYILDPVAAYEAGEIDDDNVALRRAKRADLDRLGLKSVKTLEEIRKEREKKAAKEAKQTD